MKRAALFLIGCSSVALAQLPLHPVPQVTRNGDICNLDWTGQNSITYFVQYSLDLQSWSYMPVIESGDGSAISYGFECNADKMFVRLHYTDIPTNSPHSADFDNDGLTNWEEVRVGGTGTDPFDADSNDDGIRDDGLVYAAQNDPDGAGLSPATQVGIIGRWDFEQLQFTPPALPYFPDKTGSNNHATANFGSSQETTDAIVSKSCKIPNTGYLSVPATIMNGVRTFNLSMWIKPTEGSLTGANSTKSRVIWSYGDTSTSLPLLFLYLRNGKDVILQRYNGGVVENVASWTAPENLDDGTWRHLCFAREDGGPTGTEYKLYINGVQVGNAWGGTNASFQNNPNGYFLIGRLMTANTVTQFDGLLDRVLLHNRGLTQAEALGLYRFDADGDGLWDITEHKSHLWRDLNGNEIRDSNEFGYFINPYYFDDANADHDGDGRASLEEQNDTQNPTDPSNPDSDMDLLPDGWEIDNGLNPNDAIDGASDTDGDGATNIEEYSFNSDPNNTDTDGDGVTDGVEIGGPDGNPDTPGGSNPNDASDNGQPLPSDEKLAILIGVGDQSGSMSEDYVMNIYRINPDTGSEERFYTLRSGGHGQYKEITLDIFKKTDTYTFQIDWQSSSLATSGSSSNPDGPDFDYTFKVEPQNDTTGILTDSVDIDLNEESASITGTHNDVMNFVADVEKTKRVKRSHIKFDLWVDSDMDKKRESNINGDKLPEGFFGKGSDDENKEEEERSVIVDINNDNSDKGVSGSSTSGQVDNQNTLLDTEEDRQHLTDVNREGHTFGTMRLVSLYNPKFLETTGGGAAKWILTLSLEDEQGQFPPSEQVVRVFRWEKYDKDKAEPKEVLGPGKTETTIPLNDFFSEQTKSAGARSKNVYQARDFFVEGITGGFAMVKVTLKQVAGEGAPREFTDKVRVTCNVDRVAQKAADVATKKDSRALRGLYPHYMGVRQPDIGGVDTQGNSPAIRAIRGKIIARPPSFKTSSDTNWWTNVTWMRGKKLRQFYAETDQSSGSSFWIGLKQQDANGSLQWVQCGLRWLQDEDHTHGSEPLAYLETGTFLAAHPQVGIPFNRQNAAPGNGEQAGGGKLDQQQNALQNWHAEPLILDFVLYKLPGAVDANGADVSIWSWRVIFRDSRAGKNPAHAANYISHSVSDPAPTGSVGDSVRDAFINAYKGQKLTDLDILFETNQSISFIPGTTQAPAEMKSLFYAQGLNGGVSIDSRPNDENDLVANYNWATTSFQWHPISLGTASVNRQIRTGKALVDNDPNDGEDTEGVAETIIQHPWWKLSLQNDELKLWDTRDWGFGDTE